MRKSIIKTGLKYKDPQKEKTNPLVSIVCGSKSDLPIMEKSKTMLDSFGVYSEIKVLSAHRTPDETSRYAKGAMGRGIEVIIAGAGGAAHLAGVIASKTDLPIIGVPIPTAHLGGLDSLLSIVQMPRGIPVATVAIGGSENAAILAIEILSLKYPKIRKCLLKFRSMQTRSVLKGK